MIVNCKNCGKEFDKRPSDIRRTNNNFCSRSCASTYNGRKRWEGRRKRCVYCGEPRSGRNKNYCSTRCHWDHKNDVYIKRWKEGKESGNREGGSISIRVRRYLFEKYDSSCQKCGWSEINEQTGNVPLQVHHIDGNWKNSSPNNLELLCPNCHSLTPTFGSLNNGSGRKDRKITTRGYKE